jgi:hypothetical protein
MSSHESYKYLLQQYTDQLNKLNVRTDNDAFISTMRASMQGIRVEALLPYIQFILVIVCVVLFKKYAM